MFNPRSIVIFLFVLQAFSLWSQKEIYTSQYLHNQYTVNTAFAGSTEALTLFGAFRKQWVGIDGSPQAQLVSAHTPLKNEQIALGVELFNQNMGKSGQNGFAASYTYRLRQSTNHWIGLSVNAGVSTMKANWSEVPVLEGNDPNFTSNESYFSPILGLGAAWYGQKFYTGLSTSNLFYTDIYETGETSFDFGKSQMILTAGYLAKLSNQFQLQPSALVRLNTMYGTIFDFGATVIWQDKFWAGLTYRNIDEITVLLAFQPSSQFRLSYSIDLGMGEVAQYNSGTHELTLRYYFGHKVQTSSPKFF